MKIIPLSFDSLGTRSMSTFVETKDVSILIDAGVALAPNRYGYPPHPIEIKRMMEDWAKIKKFAKKADVLVLTHYHYDHHNPEEPEIYKGKVLYIKNPKEKINASQKSRANYFLKKLGKLPKAIEVAEGKELKFGKTHVKFSKAFPHGPDEKLGCVFETAITVGKTKFIHTSDVEGATVKDQAKFIIDEAPDIVIIDGPLTWLGLHSKSMSEIVKVSKIKQFIVDHHFLRDPKWKEKMKDVFAVAEKKGTKVECVAEFLGEKITLYEPIRKKLFKDMPAKKGEPIYLPWLVKK